MKPVKLQLPNSPTVDRYQVQQDGKGEDPRQTVHDGCSGLCVKSVFFLFAARALQFVGCWHWTTHRWILRLEAGSFRSMRDLVRLLGGDGV